MSTEEPVQSIGPGVPAGLRDLAPQLNQVLLAVVGLGLAFGLLRIVSILIRTGDSGLYNFGASLCVIGVVGGLLAGYKASYGLVIILVRAVGAAGATVMFYLGFVSPSLAPSISTGLGIGVSIITLVPRVAVLGSALVMLAAAIFIVEMTRLEYLVGFSYVASGLWLTGAALLLGDGISEVFG
jgi:hypothetical protein